MSQLPPDVSRMMNGEGDQMNGENGTYHMQFYIKIDPNPHLIRIIYLLKIFVLDNHYFYYFHCNIHLFYYFFFTLFITFFFSFYYFNWFFHFFIFSFFVYFIIFSFLFYFYFYSYLYILYFLLIFIFSLGLGGMPVMDVKVHMMSVPMDMMNLNMPNLNMNMNNHNTPFQVPGQGQNKVKILKGF